MSLLSREELLKKKEIKVERVDFPDGRFLYVREMNGRERDRFEKSLLREEKNEKTGEITYTQTMEDFRAKLAVCTICNEKGESILRPGDYETLSQNTTGKDLEKIASAAQKLNRISEEEKSKLVKNSSPDQSGDSTSESGGKSAEVTPIQMNG